MDKLTGWEIPEEKAAAAMELVGKTLIGNGKTLVIDEWVGQNYKMHDAVTGVANEIPVLAILQRTSRRNGNPMFEVK